MKERTAHAEVGWKQQHTNAQIETGTHPDAKESEDDNEIEHKGADEKDNGPRVWHELLCAECRR